MSDLQKVEYRVRPVERYIITRYEEYDDGACGCSEMGIHGSPHVAYEVAYALCKDHHERLGYMPGDERVTYPQHPRPEFLTTPASEREIKAAAE